EQPDTDVGRGIRTVGWVPAAAAGGRVADGGHVTQLRLGAALGAGYRRATAERHPDQVHLRAVGRRCAGDHEARLLLGLHLRTGGRALSATFGCLTTRDGGRNDGPGCATMSVGVSVAR